MLASKFRTASRLPGYVRRVSTLTSNPHIKVFPDSRAPNNHLLTYLSTDPPNRDLAIGSTSALPPTPGSFRENPRFLRLLNDVLARYAPEDPDLKSQAGAFASPGGFTFGTGAGTASATRRKKTETETGAGGASRQGGAGGAGVGGWVHVSDRRNPPDFGRIAWPEDILGSVEVDGHGIVIGNFQPSGTYRIITNEGILGLSDFLRNKLVARLKEEEQKQ